LCHEVPEQRPESLAAEIVEQGSHDEHQSAVPDVEVAPADAGGGEGKAFDVSVVTLGQLCGGEIHVDEADVAAETGRPQLTKDEAGSAAQVGDDVGFRGEHRAPDGFDERPGDGRIREVSFVHRVPSRALNARLPADPVAIVVDAHRASSP
jgi:hypothetical protein